MLDCMNEGHVSHEAVKLLCHRSMLNSVISKAEGSWLKEARDCLQSQNFSSFPPTKLSYHNTAKRFLIFNHPSSVLAFLSRQQP